jgi:hypothetical protein
MMSCDCYDKHSMCPHVTSLSNTIPARPPRRSLPKSGVHERSLAARSCKEHQESQKIRRFGLEVNKDGTKSSHPPFWVTLYNTQKLFFSLLMQVMVVQVSPSAAEDETALRTTQDRTQGGHLFPSHIPSLAI